MLFNVQGGVVYSENRGVQRPTGSRLSVAHKPHDIPISDWLSAIDDRLNLQDPFNHTINTPEFGKISSTLRKTSQFGGSFHELTSAEGHLRCSLQRFRNIVKLEHEKIERSLSSLVEEKEDITFQKDTSSMLIGKSSISSLLTDRLRENKYLFEKRHNPYAERFGIWVKKSILRKCKRKT
jgi:hypothetical protein